MEQKDYSLLRPLDLEAAKRGEAIFWTPHTECIFLGRSVLGYKKEMFMIEHKQGLSYAEAYELRMAPICWVEGRPVYRGDVLYWSNGRHVKFTVGDRFIYGSGLLDGTSVFDTGESTGGDGMSGVQPEILTWTPPTVKRTVKLLAWFDSDQLFWLRDGAKPKWPSVRVPLEDRAIEIEEPAEVAK